MKSKTTLTAAVTLIGFLLTISCRRVEPEPRPPRLILKGKVARLFAEHGVRFTFDPDLFTQGDEWTRQARATDDGCEISLKAEKYDWVCVSVRTSGGNWISEFRVMNLDLSKGRDCVIDFDAFEKRLKVDETDSDRGLVSFLIETVGVSWQGLPYLKRSNNTLAKAPAPVVTVFREGLPDRILLRRKMELGCMGGSWGTWIGDIPNVEPNDRLVVTVLQDTGGVFGIVKVSKTISASRVISEME